jgi:ubiquinone/menaquinone biosynthesis C-methylase UbiE
MLPESDDQRVNRRRRRVLFESVAGRYQVCRHGYPADVVDWMVATAGVAAGGSILEIGCGTGQLTTRLVALPASVVAIDIAPSMVEVAQQQLIGSAVRFEVASFEEFEADPGSFDLVASATAFHWIDPDVAWSKSARLLRPGGWLAVLGVGEEYADPVGGRIADAWIRHVAKVGASARARNIAVEDAMDSTGLFAPARLRSHVEQTVMRPEVVLDLERTRATYLDFDAVTRDSFTAAIEEAVAGLAEVPAEIHAHIAMAQRLP